MHEFTPEQIARYMAVLPGDSFVMMKAAGNGLSLTDTLLAMCLDCLRWIQWSKTEDGADNINQPPSVYEMLTGMDMPKAEKTNVYDTAEEFEEARKRLIRGGKDG